MRIDELPMAVLNFNPFEALSRQSDQLDLFELQADRRRARFNRRKRVSV